MDSAQGSDLAPIFVNMSRNEKKTLEIKPPLQPSLVTIVYFTLLLGYFSGFSGFYLAWKFVYAWLFPGVEEVP